ncbi:MAG: MerR family transcriptional regulator [Flavobacteriales bacterium]
MEQGEGEKLYYSIGEVAEHLGVKPSLIRYWEKEFPMVEPRKNRKGDRSFTQKEIRTLERIHTLVKKEGFTLKGAKKRMREKGSGDQSTEEALERLKGLRKELEAWKEALTKEKDNDQ